MKRYKIVTWKLKLEGDYNSEAEAIQDLGRKYLDALENDSRIKALKNTSLKKKGQLVYLYEEHNSYGPKHLHFIHTLLLLPAKTKKLKYEIIPPKEY